MKQIVAAVCDTDEQYLNRFATYMRNHDTGEIMIYTFTKLEAFMQGLLSIQFNLVLIGQGFEAAKEGLKQYRIPTLYLAEEVGLEQEAQGCVAEAGNYCCKQERTILKYQSADTILHEMYGMTEPAEQNFFVKEGQPIGAKMEIIGVYSPIQHEMQVPFSVTVASLLAEKKKVLYLNFMECAGFLELFQLEEGEHHLGDLLARLHQNRLSEEGVRQVTYQSEQLYFVPPARNPENLYQLTKEEYRNLLGFLEQKMDFEVLVIDFGSMLSGFFELLKGCSEIYCLMKTGPFYECRKEQFLHCIELAGQRELEDRIQTIYLPYSASQVVPAVGLMEQFKWSELGDLVRSKIFGAAYDC